MNKDPSHLEYLRREVGEALGEHIVGVFGGTILYSHELPSEEPIPKSEPMRETESELPFLLV